MSIECDTYLQHGIELPVEGNMLQVAPLHDRVDRVLKSIRNYEKRQANASIGYLASANQELSDHVWLSIIMNLKRHGVEEMEDEFALPYIGHTATIDLHDPESERTLRVTEYVGPLVVGRQVFECASNFAILSAIDHYEDEDYEDIHSSSILLTLAD